MNKIIVLLIVLFLSISCGNENNTIVDVSNIEIDVNVDRFEQKFYNSNEESLQLLKKEYPYLFPAKNSDSIWLNKINNEEERVLFKKSEEVFGDFEAEKSEIKTLFKHIKYYHPNFKSPKIITLITHLDYESNVIYADSLLFVSIDMYLGKNDEVYQSFPAYISQNFEKQQLVVDIAKEIGGNYFYESKKRQFLDVIIYEGKKMYLLDSYLPTTSDACKMGYLPEEIAWAEANETQVWKYFVENELLYSSDPKLSSRFIDKAPFSKFFIDIDKESPGRIGTWLGWQIVRSYMKNNNVTLQQLLQTNAEEIFKKAKYKPKK